MYSSTSVHGRLGLLPCQAPYNNNICSAFYALQDVSKKLNKPEIAHRLCKAPQCTKFFIEIGCLDTDVV